MMNKNMMKKREILDLKRRIIKKMILLNLKNICRIMMMENQAKLIQIKKMMKMMMKKNKKNKIMNKQKMKEKIQYLMK